jgi:hypothetical protein
LLQQFPKGLIMTRIATATRTAIKRNEKRALKQQALRQLEKDCRHEAASFAAEEAHGWPHDGLRTSGVRNAPDDISLALWETLQGRFEGADVVPFSAAKLTVLVVYSDGYTAHETVKVTRNGWSDSWNGSWAQSIDRALGGLSVFWENESKDCLNEYAPYSAYIEEVEPLTGSVEGLTLEEWKLAA